MKVKFGSIVTDARGKIGGHVASKNRAGSYFRTKVTPVNPNTSYQSTARSRLASLSTAWRALSSAQRLLWNNAVLAFQKTDIFGDIKTPTGFNLHQALNNNLLRIGVAVISAPPLPQNLPPIETGVLTVTNAGVVKVTFTDDPVTTDSEIEAYATPALSPGKNFVKSELRRIGKAPAIAAHDIDLATLYTTKFGAVGAVGQKVFVALKQISKTSGQSGVLVIYSALIS